MKKTLNIFSIITSIFIVLGALFKFMHWPGAGLMLMLSMGFLSIGFIPVYAKSKINALNGWKIKFAVGLGWFCISLLNLSILFKIMHWPFASGMIVLSMGIFALFFIPAYSIHKMRHSENGAEKIMNISGGISISIIILGLLFKITHWPGASMLLLFGVLLLLTLCLPFLLRSYKNDINKRSDALVRFTFISVLVTTLLAFLFNNASRMFMNSFALTQENIEASSNNINIRNANILASLEKNNSAFQKAKKARELSNDLYNYISDLKSHLIGTVEGISKEEADSLAPADITNKDNYDITTRALIGELESPREGSFSAIELKNKIAVFREDILSMLNEKERAEADKTIGLSLEDTFEPQDGLGMVKWEIHTFYNVPISGVLNTLSQIQNNVRMAENDVMNSLRYQIATTEITETSK